MSSDLEKIRGLLKVHGSPPREVYYDFENSGWVPPEVVEAMLPYFNVKLNNLEAAISKLISCNEDAEVLN